jgi:hypothetical protein
MEWYRMSAWILAAAMVLGPLAAVEARPASAAPPPEDADADTSAGNGKLDAGQDGNPAASAAGLTKLSQTGAVWLDTKRKAVVVDGQVCLRAGQLEMFACPKGTKEHESIVSLNCQAQEVHAGLLAAGATPGTPVRFDPEYKPATGQIIDIYVLWKDAEGKKHQVRAQDWIKNTKTGKALEYNWVFAGSGFWKDDETGHEHYKANGGDLVCVSNFTTATLDLPVESSQANADLMFEAFTDRVPPRGTKVRVVFIPRPAQPKATSDSAATKTP